MSRERIVGCLTEEWERGLSRFGISRHSSVLILDGGGRNALAATRSIGRLGARVMVADVTRNSLAGTSRYANGLLLCPRADRDPEGFIETVMGATRDYGFDVILPMSEASLELMLQAREELLPTRIPFGPLAAFEVLNNKIDVLLIARELGIATPKSVIVHSGLEISESLDEIGELAHYPLVLKPYRSRIPEGKSYLNGKVRYAASRKELLVLAQTEPAFRHHPFLVQEHIDGVGAGISLLLNGADVIASFAHQRIRERPPSGGESVFSMAVKPCKVMQAAAEDILTTVGWQGVAMTEFKIDAHGTPYLMEVNARFWGSLQLAIDSGIDFPALLILWATGKPSATIPGYRTDRKSRWLLGDLESLSHSICSDQPLGRKLQAIRDFFATFVDPSVSSAVFRWSDVRPAAMEFINAWKAFRSYR